MFRKLARENRLFAYAPFSESLANRYPQSIQWHHYRAIIADLGDTTLPGLPMVEALQRAIQEDSGLSIPLHILYEGFGMPKQTQIRQILEREKQEGRVKWSSNQLNEKISSIHSCFEQKLIDYYNRYGVSYLSGTEDAIRTFHRQGINFGATTGLSPKLISHIETRLPLWRPYPIVSCERPSPDGIYKMLDIWNKNAPEHQKIRLNQCLKIGDSRSDQDEANKAGIPFVGITKHRALSLSLAGGSKAWLKPAVLETDLQNEFMLRGAITTVGTLDDLALLMCPWMKLGI